MLLNAGKLLDTRQLGMEVEVDELEVVEIVQDEVEGSKVVDQIRTTAANRTVGLLRMQLTLDTI